MPEFFFWSSTGESAFLARRLHQEGHRVRLYTSEPRAKNIYRGLIPLAQSPDPKRGEFVIFDGPGHGMHADSLRRKGYKVLGAAGFADAIEGNKQVGINTMRSVGIRTPEFYMFRSFDSVKEFLKTHPERWHCSLFGTEYSYDGIEDELIRLIAFAARLKPQAFMLQKHIEGTKLRVGGWFDGTKFVWPFTSMVCDKHFLDGDMGPRTTGMASAAWVYETSHPTLALQTLSRIAPLLESVDYVGPIDIDIIIDEKGNPNGIEWTPRLNNFQAICSLIQGDFGHQLARFMAGSLDGFDARTDVYCLTANISVPPFPYDAKEAAGFPIPDTIIRDPRVYPRDIQLDKNSKCIITGVDACVGTVRALGTDLTTLREEVLALIKTLSIPNVQHRMQLVPRAAQVLSALSSFAFDQPLIRIVVPERTWDLGEELSQKDTTVGKASVPVAPPSSLASRTIVPLPNRGAVPAYE